jgi:aspartate/methionine/tyrosine aminotransferase
MATFEIKQKIRNIIPSATLAINEQSAAMIASGRHVVRFGFGQSPFPVPDIVRDSLRAHAHEKAYLPVKGLQSLRESAAAFLSRTRKLDLSAEQVLIGPGSKELIYLMQACLNGTLYLPTPSWVSYAPQSEIIGNDVRWLHKHASMDWKITAATLDETVDSPGFLILNYPNNPTGVTYTAQELQALAEVARAKELLVISDEIYAMTHFEGAHVSIATYYPEGTIISTGLSKWCGAGGWRLGIAAFPEACSELMLFVAILASETFTSVSAPIQFAAITAYQHLDELERYLTNTRKILKVVAFQAYDWLHAINIECAKPEGGYYLFVDFRNYKEQLRARGITTSDALCKALLQEQAVALLPGSVFGHAAEELTGRLSYVDFDGAEALRHIDSLDEEHPEEWLVQYVPNLKLGVDRIAEWLR